MELGPLRKAAVAELIGRELDEPEPPAGLADFVYLRSEGNPLFVTALVEHLIAQCFLVRNGHGQWERRAPFEEMEASVPDQLARMIEMEIGRLSEHEQHMLEAASLMRVAFPAWAVAAALQKDSLETEEACDALARRLHFVLRAGQDEMPDGSRSAFYVLAHGLYREVLYHRQSEARRARRHVRIAERLGELFAGREADVARERAMHYEAAGDRERAASVLHAAAIGRQQAGVCS
jgi:predicted ATPase